MILQLTKSRLVFLSTDLVGSAARASDEHLNCWMMAAVPEELCDGCSPSVLLCPPRDQAVQDNPSLLDISMSGKWSRFRYLSSYLRRRICTAGEGVSFVCGVYAKRFIMIAILTTTDMCSFSLIQLPKWTSP